MESQSFIWFHFSLFRQQQDLPQQQLSLVIIYSGPCENKRRPTQEDLGGWSGEPQHSTSVTGRGINYRPNETMHIISHGSWATPAAWP